LVLVGIFHNVWYGKLEWCGYEVVKKFHDMITRFDTIYDGDRQTYRHTDRQTPHDGRQTEMAAQSSSFISD